MKAQLVVLLASSATAAPTRAASTLAYANETTVVHAEGGIPNSVFGCSINKNILKCLKNKAPQQVIDRALQSNPVLQAIVQVSSGLPGFNLKDQLVSLISINVPSSAESVAESVASMNITAKSVSSQGLRDTLQSWMSMAKSAAANGLPSPQEMVVFSEQMLQLSLDAGLALIQMIINVDVQGVKAKVSSFISSVMDLVEGLCDCPLSHMMSLFREHFGAQHRAAGASRHQVTAMLAADMLDDIDFDGIINGIAGAVNGVVEQLATLLSPAINAVLEGGKIATNWAVGIFEALPIAAEHRAKTHRVSQRGGVSNLLSPDQKWASYVDPTSVAEVEVYNHATKSFAKAKCRTVARHMMDDFADESVDAAVWCQANRTGARSCANRRGQKLTVAAEATRVTLLPLLTALEDFIFTEVAQFGVYLSGVMKDLKDKMAQGVAGLIPEVGSFIFALTFGPVTASVEKNSLSEKLELFLNKQWMIRLGWWDNFKRVILDWAVPFARLVLAEYEYGNGCSGVDGCYSEERYNPNNFVCDLAQASDGELWEPLCDLIFGLREGIRKLIMFHLGDVPRLTSEELQECEADILNPLYRTLSLVKQPGCQLTAEDAVCGADASSYDDDPIEDPD